MLGGCATVGSLLFLLTDYVPDWLQDACYNVMYADDTVISLPE